MIDGLFCPSCGSETLHKGGKTTNQGSIKQRYRCWTCKKRTTKPRKPDIEVEMREHLPKRKRYLVTSAQNATPIHKDLWSSLKHCADYYNAELVVVPSRYKNPTSQWSEEQDTLEWWDSAVMPYLVKGTINLSKRLCILDTKVQWTAQKPLTSLETLTGDKSGIVGHPKVALKSVATPQHQNAKMMYTTGCVTQPNYTDTKQGDIGKFHHTYGAVIAEVDGYVEFGRDYKNKRRISINPRDDEQEIVEYLIPKGKHISVQEGDFIRRGEYLIDGNPAPHDILKSLGIEALAAYLVKEVQDVYRLQGVGINDKHIEVIVRQMLKKVEITKPGETTFLIGEQIEREEFDEVNAKAIEEGRQPAKGEAILLGITKASLQTRSFISAASFQETTRVLTEAAVSGKSDKLIGLKENVIVGRLIPAGTGSKMKEYRHIAQDRDEQTELEQQASNEIAIHDPLAESLGENDDSSQKAAEE